MSRLGESNIASHRARPVHRCTQVAMCTPATARGLHFRHEPGHDGDQEALVGPSPGHDACDRREQDRAASDAAAVGTPNAQYSSRTTNADGCGAGHRQLIGVALAVSGQVRVSGEPISDSPHPSRSMRRVGVPSPPAALPERDLLFCRLEQSVTRSCGEGLVEGREVGHDAVDAVLGGAVRVAEQSLAQRLVADPTPPALRPAEKEPLVAGEAGDVRSGDAGE